MRFIKAYFKVSLVKKILAAMIIGVVLGLIFGEPVAVIYPFGDLFIRLLKMIVMPIILFTIIVGASFIHPAQLGRVGVRVFIFYMCTSIFAITIGLILANVFSLGEGLSLPALTENFKPNVKAPTVVEVILNVVPTNPFGSLSTAKPLQIIFFGLIFGFSLAYLKHSDNAKIKKHAETTYGFFEICAQCMFKITRGILEYAPIGILAIMATVIGQSGAEVVGPFLGMVLVAYLGMGMMIFVVYPSLLLLFGISPFKFFMAVKEAMLTAYTSRTSSGTLPVSIDCAQNKLGISNKVASFSLPLGATINMDGTSLYLAIEVIFAAHVFGVDLSMSQQITILLTALLASIGTAGVPSASLVMLIGILKVVKLPTSIIPMFAGFDPICDMMRTMTNVTGDLTGTTIVAKVENEIDYNKGVWRKS